MRSVLTGIISGNLIIMILAIACSNPKSKTKSNYQESKLSQSVNKNLSIGEGQRIASNLGCMNCHLFGSSHMANNLHKPSTDKKEVLNLQDLCKVDSMKIYEFVIKNKHKGIYKNDPNFNKLTSQDISNIIYYLHSCDRLQYK
ncbi:c-type cytochrome [Mucilaginibacter sp. KACC 22063]|uniref:c-type cytochrome n=1 Tax=Mucilaginibacter sp. KACC 22063 TaxID=3025666 RepID=UPI0023672740|nr:c-type cytochrome [Mucilaginibacter sp. KACC 22063]WDF56446.1 c-type cytochrome [Mucilaginibacter sp. KACC 22063]